jgi:hypothetical protein
VGLRRSVGGPFVLFENDLARCQGRCQHHGMDDLDGLAWRNQGHARFWGIMGLRIIENAGKVRTRQQGGGRRNGQHNRGKCRGRERARLRTSFWSVEKNLQDEVAVT